MPYNKIVEWKDDEGNRLLDILRNECGAFGSQGLQFMHAGSMQAQNFNRKMDEEQCLQCVVRKHQLIFSHSYSVKLLKSISTLYLELNFL